MSKTNKTLYLLFLTLAITAFATFLWLHNSASSTRINVDSQQSRDYMMIADQLAYEIGKDISSTNIRGIKDKVSTLADKHNVNFLRLFNENGALIFEYLNQKVTSNAFEVGHRNTEKHSEKLFVVSSLIYEKSKSIGYLEIGFPKHFDGSSNEQDDQLVVVDEVLNIIVISIFSFALGVYLTNLYVQIKARLTSYDSRYLVKQ